MLNLKKILLRLKKKLSKTSAEEITSELVRKALVENDPHAMDIVGTELIRSINNAMHLWKITPQLSYDEQDDFRGYIVDTLIAEKPRTGGIRLLEWNPERGAQFSSHIANHVKNMWLNWVESKKRGPKEVSIETPIAEGLTLGETLEAPALFDFVSSESAQVMYDQLLSRIPNPKYRDLLEMWISTGGSGLEKSEIIAKALNKKYPEEPISPHRVYRVIRDEIRPLAMKLWPEQVPSTHEFEEAPPEISEEEIAQELGEYGIPTGPAPIYRINPETGTRERISLNLRKRYVISSQDKWFYTLINWFSFERKYGKFK